MYIKIFESTNIIYDASFSSKVPNATKIRIHRIEQLSGATLGNDCPLVLKVDGIEVAGLQQNQFIDVYLPEVNHKLSVRFKCALTAWLKSVEVNADGELQEYKTKIGATGQYQIWRLN